jgi:hypothetical protein
MIGAPIMIDGAPMTTDVLPSCEGEAAPAGARAVNLLIARNAYREAARIYPDDWMVAAPGRTGDWEEPATQCGRPDIETNSHEPR